MKKILFAIAALAVAFGFTACSNEDETLENGKNGNTIITAFTEEGTTRTALDGNDEKGYDVVWSKGDQFNAYSYDLQQMNWKNIGTFTLVSEAGTTKGTFEANKTFVDQAYTAYYPAGYMGVNWPATQIYTEGNITGFPMKGSYAPGSSTIQFKNEGGILRLKVSGDKSVKSISVRATGLKSSITLDCDDGVADGIALTSEGTVFHIAMPTGETSTTYSNVKITLTDTNGSTCTKTFKGTNGLKIERSKITTASFTASFPPTDALSGKFSVSDDNKKVYFAKGNLYYDGSAFKLEDNQYSIATSWDSTKPHVSNFYWSATAANACASSCAYEKTNGVFFTNASETTPSTSFTVNGQTGVWRTLSASEWGYLFSHYTYKYTSVCGKSGIVIAPAGVTTIANSYNATAWTTAEADGFVFLPNTGFRNSEDGWFDELIHETEKSCFYWSSTLNGDGKPYREFFQWNEEKLTTDINIDSPCWWAIGIRLVQDVK